MSPSCRGWRVGWEQGDEVSRLLGWEGGLGQGRCVSSQGRPQGELGVGDSLGAKEVGVKLAEGWLTGLS